MLGQPGTHLAFDWPSPYVLELTEDEDAADMATTYLVTSQVSDDGGEERTLMGRADNPDLLDLGFPALWRVDSSHSNVSRQETVDSYANAYATAAREPAVLRPLKIRTDHPDHPLGTYRPGYTANITVHRDPWIPVGTYTQRIVDVAIAGREATLTISEVPAE